MIAGLPSGKVAIDNRLLTVDLPIQYGDFPQPTVSLPEGISVNIPVLSHHYPIITPIKPFQLILLNTIHHYIHHFPVAFPMSGLEVRLDALASHLARTGSRQHGLLLSHQVVTEGTRGALGAPLATNGGRGWVLKPWPWKNLDL